MVIDPDALPIFIPVALALNLTPGADMLFCLGQEFHGGARTGRVASFGIFAGCAVHVVLAADRF